MRGCCYGNKCDQPDNPREGMFCSLCGPKYNAPDRVSFWYPRAKTQNIVELAQVCFDLGSGFSGFSLSSSLSSLSISCLFAWFPPFSHAFGAIYTLPVCVFCLAVAPMVRMLIGACVQCCTQFTASGNPRALDARHRHRRWRPRQRALRPGRAHGLRTKQRCIQ